MVKARRTSVVEILEYNGFVAEEIDSLQTAFKDWNSTEGQGNHKLWNMLGTVYELGAKVNANGAAMDDLIKQVKSVDSVKDNNHWDPDKKTADELLLTLLLGLKPETKATKSQWLGAIKAARKAMIKPERDECSAWLKSVGGVQAARKTLKRPAAKKSFEEWVKAVENAGDDFDPAYPPFAIPAPLNDQDFQSDLGIVLVRRLRDTGKFVPVCTVASRPLIIQAIKSLLAEEIRFGRDMEREIKKEEADIRRRLMPAWKRWKQMYPEEYDTFDQWYEHGAEEVTSHPSVLEGQKVQTKFMNKHRKKMGFRPLKPYK